MQKILVTGGNGFIGKHFILYLIKKDVFVINVDASTYASNNIPVNANNYIYYQADIRDYPTMDKIFNRESPDIVINFAAETHVDRSWIYKELFHDVNVNGVKVLLDLSLKYKVKRFHQVSTDEVYGSLKPDNRPFKENDPLRPTNPYSQSKAAADELVLEYSHKYGLPISITRSTNNYGPYQFPEKLIPLMIYKAYKDEPLPIYGDGHNIRDWLYVDDHCKGILAVIEKGRAGEIYNLSGHTEIDNLTVVKRILKEMGKEESLITHVQDRQHHDKRYAIDSSKAYGELGWEPVTMFEDGIKETINWYLSDIGVKWLEECIRLEKDWLSLNYKDRG